jgi:SET domain-containing protein
LLLVRTSVQQSPIHGLGLFAEEHIESGTTLWRFEPLLDKLIEERDLASLPAAVVSFLDVYSEYFPELGLLVLSGDNDRYTNHSDDPNTEVILPNGPHAHVRAVRDILPGEEITCSYNVIHCRAHPVTPKVARRAKVRRRATLNAMRT